MATRRRRLRVQQQQRHDSGETEGGERTAELAAGDFSEVRNSLSVVMLFDDGDVGGGDDEWRLEADRSEAAARLRPRRRETDRARRRHPCRQTTAQRVSNVVWQKAALSRLVAKSGM